MNEPEYVCDVAGCEQAFPTMTEVIHHERLHSIREDDRRPSWFVVLVGIWCMALGLGFFWLIVDDPAHGPLAAHCDSHRSLIYEQDQAVKRIVEFHPDCRP